MLFMGIDIGSSGCKVSAVNETGDIIHSSHREYSFSYNGDKIELNPSLVLEKVKDAVKEITVKNPSLKIDALSATSFGEMVILLDDEGNPLADSISYSDSRGQKQIREFAASFGEDRIYSVTGTTPESMYSLAKLLWFKENEPEIFSKTKKICLFADFILQKLGADYHMDYSLASRTQMFDVRERNWSSEIISLSGIDEIVLPPLVPSGTPVGKVSKLSGEEFGLDENTLILAGGHDQCFASLGAGVISGGVALDGMGSNECIVPVFDSPIINDTMKKSSFACVPYIPKGKYVTYAFNRSCGTVIDWYRNLRENPDYEKMFSNLKNEPSKVLCLPHFSGAATPYMDDDAKGAIVGLDLSVSADDITKGIIDGLNYEMKINIDALSECGQKVKKLYVSGGLSKSDFVLQTKSDILGMEVLRLKTPHTGTLAVAILACVALGIYPTLEVAVEKMVHTEKVFTPNMENHQKYMKQYKKYKKMYECIKIMTEDE